MLLRRFCCCKYKKLSSILELLTSHHIFLFLLFLNFLLFHPYLPLPIPVLLSICTHTSSAHASRFSLASFSVSFSLTAHYFIPFYLYPPLFCCLSSHSSSAHASFNIQSFVLHVTVIIFILPRPSLSLLFCFSIFHLCCFSPFTHTICCRSL